MRIWSNHQLSVALVAVPRDEAIYLAHLSYISLAQTVFENTTDNYFNIFTDSAKAMFQATHSNWLE